MHCIKRLFAGVLLFSGLVCFGCAAVGPDNGVKGPTLSSVDPACLTAPSVDAETGSPDYQIQPGDKVNISFYLNPEFNADVTIRPDGKISMPVVGELPAAGKTPSQLAAYLDRKYSDELRNPSVVVRVDASPSRVIYVTGEVEHDGAIPLQRGMTALQAIAEAGGMKDTAGPQDVLLIRRSGCSEPQSKTLDLSRVINRQSNSEDALLMPMDIVIVPRSGIARANLVIKQYIRDMLPLTPFVPIP